MTLTQRPAPLVLCRCWPRRITALTENLREASRQDVARCCRDKLDVACCVVHNHDFSLNYPRIRFPTDRKLSRLGDGRLTKQDIARCCHDMLGAVPSCLQRQLTSQKSLQSAPFKRRVGRAPRTSSMLESWSRPPAYMSKSSSVRLRFVNLKSFVGSIGAAFRARKQSNSQAHESRTPPER